MHTTTAAAQAGVTTDTIRRWCRYGAIAATKRAGRWIIDAASLAHRITIGKEHRMTDTYQVTETVNSHGTTVYTVTRTDGTDGSITGDIRIYNATYTNREHAEFHCAFVNRTPREYRIERRSHPSRSIHSGYYWKITGSRTEDPSDLQHMWEDGQDVKGNWPEGTTPVDVLVSLALRHAEDADARIAKKVETDAVEAAEAAVRESREEQLAQARAKKGALATPRQVEYILQLLAARERSGEGGGFFYGPTDRAGIEELSKGEASTYITSLKGDY